MENSPAVIKERYFSENNPLVYQVKIAEINGGESDVTLRLCDKKEDAYKIKAFLDRKDIKSVADIRLQGFQFKRKLIFEGCSW